MFQLWLTLRLFRKGRMFGWTTILSLIGVVLGVASLVVSMSVISGVETYLRRAVIDVTGHLMLMKPGGERDPMVGLKAKLEKAVPSLVAITPFVHIEAVVPKKGKIYGVVLQGLDTSTVDDVLALRTRVTKGEFFLSEFQGLDGALVGKELAQKLGVGVGDELQVVMPKPSKTDDSSFSPMQAKFRISGILDLGKYELNERYIVVSDLAAQRLAGIGNVYSGVRIRLKSENDTREATFQITSELGHPYWVRDWYESNHNFFSAIEHERPVIFLVIMFMVLVASLNISSSLYVNVMKRFADISILRTLGAKRSQLVRLFVLQGLGLGFLGSLMGLGLGVAVAQILVKSDLAKVPPEVYKFDHLPVEFRFWDLTGILIATFVICFISTLIPSLRGAKLNPVEGLRYE